jgi:hypothetical protein
MNESVAIFVHVIHVAIRSAVFEAKFLKDCVNFFVPCARTLLEAVERFLELANKLLLSWFGEAWRLTHEDCFFEKAVEEGGADVHVVNIPPLGGSENNCGAYCGPLDDRGESFGEVDAFSLLETVGDEFGFLPRWLGSLSWLELEDPFVGYSSGS